MFGIPRCPVIWGHQGFDLADSRGTSQKVRAVMPLLPKSRSFWFQLGPG
jgi:hypothetical protein